MRFFIELQYIGTNYSGWQRQKNAITIQELVEDAMTQVFKQEIQVVGCGRTDTGVHASQYFAHFDLDRDFTFTSHVYFLNQLLTEAIRVVRICRVDENAHARFDARRRGYTYKISEVRSPFDTNVFAYRRSIGWDLDTLNQCARLVLSNSDHFPFCKSHSDVKHYECVIHECHWDRRSDGVLYFYIEANRFLRGMVRLLVGMCINVAENKLSLGEVEKAYNAQKRLSRDWSVPAQGLFLSKVEYPDTLFLN